MQKLGQSKLVALPEGWQEVESQTKLNSCEAGEGREFYLSSHPEVKFHYFSSANLIAPMVAMEFMDLLQVEPHSLSSEEFANIEIVVGEACEPEFFEMQGHRTQLISNRTVLVVEGVWKFSNQKEISIFVPVDDDGRAIDEFHCSAPREIFETYRPQFEQIIYSIGWSST